MKRLLTLLMLALCLTLLLPLTAGAAGNAIIAREGFDGFEDHVDAVCAVDNTLWLSGGEQVYSYDTQTGEMTAWRWSDEYNEGRKGLYDQGYKVYLNNQGWFSWNGGVYTLRTATRMTDDYSYYELEEVMLCRVAAQDGVVSLEEVAEIDYREFVDGDSFSFRSCCVVGDLLCGSMWTDAGSALALIPLTGEQPELLLMDHLERICPYNGGLLMLEVRDAGGLQCIEQFSRMDISTGKTEKLFEWEHSSNWSCGLVQEAGSDRLLMIKDGRLCALDLATGQTEALTSFPISVDSSGGAEACMLPNGVYASGGFMGVALRDLAHPIQNECELTVAEISWSEQVENAVIGFGQTHPEISVVRTMPDADAALEQLLTRSDEVDIYIMDSQYDSLLSAVLAREWAAPLSGSEKLTAHAQALYPELAQALSGEEGFLGLLLEAWPMGLGINVQCLEELGLTIEEVPTNWPDFLDFLGRLVADGCPVPIGLNWFSAEDVYRDLAECILETYAKEVACGASEGYDTPELRAALDALNRLDCEALFEITVNRFSSQAVVQEAGSTEDAVFSGNPLFSSYGSVGVDDCSFEDGLTYYHFLPSISADRPVRMAVGGLVAIVNPASQHIDQAILFMEALLDQISPTSLATMCPQEGQPCRRSDYEKERQLQEERVASLKNRLENAVEADRQMIEGELAQAEEWLNTMDSYFWEISPQSLEWYRAHDDYVMLRVAGELEEINLYSLLMQVAQADPAQRTDLLITELQRQADMRRLEST